MIDIDKRNSSKRGVAFYQCHKGHRLRFQYMFIESPKALTKKEITLNEDKRLFVTGRTYAEVQESKRLKY